MTQIKIIKSTQPTYWYHNRINEIFNVYDDGHDQWYIPYDDELLFILKEDTEIFDRKKKIERIKSKFV
jgi:hypothetical protein